MEDIKLGFFSLTDENLSIHNMPEQLNQQMYIKNYTVKKVNSSPEVYSEDKENVFYPTLSSCDCEYFLKEKLPCTHMYALATKRELFVSSRILRSEKLLADFSKGYANGWKFVVRPCNYPALDIFLTPKVIDTQKQLVWTQGHFYDFHSGSTFYNDIVAYEEKWGKAKKKLFCYVEVTNAMTNIVEHYVKISHRTFRQKNIDEEYEKDVFENSYKFEYGKIDFILFLFSGNIKLHFSCTQYEFVNLLRYGCFTDISGKFHNVFEVNPYEISLFDLN